MRNNKNLESDFADTENLEMTPEVEQELNKIYEEKEGIDMLNNNKIKRGTEIKTMRESLIYDLYFLKESCLMYKKYILDWKSLDTKSYSISYHYIDFLKVLNLSHLKQAYLLFLLSYYHLNFLNL